MWLRLQYVILYSLIVKLVCPSIHWRYPERCVVAVKPPLIDEILSITWLLRSAQGSTSLLEGATSEGGATS